MSDSGQAINKKVILSPSFLLRKGLFILKKSNRFESIPILVELIRTGNLEPLRIVSCRENNRKHLEDSIKYVYEDSLKIKEDCTLIISNEEKFISVPLINLKTCDELKEEIDKNLFRIGLGFN